MHEYNSLGCVRYELFIITSEIYSLDKGLYELDVSGFLSNREVCGEDRMCRKEEKGKEKEKEGEKEEEKEKEKGWMMFIIYVVCEAICSYSLMNNVSVESLDSSNLVLPLSHLLRVSCLVWLICFFSSGGVHLVILLSITLSRSLSLPDPSKAKVSTLTRNLNSTSKQTNVYDPEVV